MWRIVNSWTVLCRQPARRRAAARSIRRRRINLNYRPRGCSFRAASPLGDGFPIRIVLRLELAAAAMEIVAAGSARQRVLQQGAVHEIGFAYQSRDSLK